MIAETYSFAAQFWGVFWGTFLAWAIGGLVWLTVYLVTRRQVRA